MRIPSGIRRVAFALMAARFLVFALAPALGTHDDANAPSDIAAVFSGHEQADPPVHDPAACLACHVLQSHVCAPPEHTVSLSLTERRGTTSTARTFAVAAASRAKLHSRAPPHSFA